MKFLIALLFALIFWYTPAQAQNVNINCFTGTAPNQWNPASSSNPCPVAIVPSSSTNVGLTPVVGGSAASSQVLKATPGNLYSVYAVCTAACWLQVFNATSAPVNGATTAGTASGNMVECVPITAGSQGGVNYIPGPPAAYSVGITAMISSTSCGTLTASTVGFIHGFVQ